MSPKGLMDYPGLGGKKPKSGVVVAISAGEPDEDPTTKACLEFFEAAGIEPKDEAAACEALVALIDIRFSEDAEPDDKEPTEDDDEEA